DAADIAPDDGGHVGAADLDRLDDLDIGRLGHRVGRLDQGHPALGLDQADRLAEVAVSAFSVCHWCSSVGLSVVSSPLSVDARGAAVMEQRTTDNGQRTTRLLLRRLARALGQPAAGWRR